MTYIPRYRLEFDPTDPDTGASPYFWSSEPGVDAEIHGDQLASRTGMNKNGETVPFIHQADNFILIPGTTWLCCKPRQWQADWRRSPFLADYVATKDKWDWCDGLNTADAVQDWNPLDLPDTPGTEGGEFMLFTVPEEVGTQPYGIDFDAVSTAMGVDLPTGMAVLAATKREVFGYKTPFLQAQIYPEPQDTLAFGFGDVMLVLFGGVAYVLQDRAFGVSSPADWHLIHSFLFDQISAGMDFRPLAGTVSAGKGGIPSTLTAGRLRSVAVMLAGFDDLYLSGGLPGQVVQLRDTGEDGSTPRDGCQVKTGKWWFAGFPGQKFALQAQAVNYLTAEHGAIDDPTDLTAIMLDLGDGYAPGAASQPSLYPAGMLIINPADPADQVVTALTAGVRYESTKYGDGMEVQLIDGDNQPWVSNGDLRSGGIRLKLTPGSDVDEETEADSFGNLECISPQIRLVQVQFPVQRTARVRPSGMPVYLNDDAFLSVHLQTSLRDPFGKRVRVLLWEKGTKALEIAGVDRRKRFPVHLVEDLTGVGTFASKAVRIAFWVEKINWTEHTWAIDGGTHQKDPTAPLRAYEFEGEGNVSRMRRSPWRYFRSIVDPLNAGQLEMTTAAERVISQTGFDPADPIFVDVEDDSESMDDIRRLPGTPDLDPGTTGQRVDQPYGPDDGEDPASYIARIGMTWRGWLLFDTAGRQIRFQHDYRRDAGEVVPVATLYFSKLLAVAAGANERQVWAPASKVRYEGIISNWVKVGGKGYDGKPLPVMVDVNWDSINNPAADTFVGEPMNPIEVTPKMAVDVRSQSVIAREYLIRVSRNEMARDVENYMAPWDVAPSGVECGEALTLQHGQGDWLVAAIDTVLLSAASKLWHTQYTGEFLQLAVS